MSAESTMITTSAPDISIEPTQKKGERKNGRAQSVKPAEPSFLPAGRERNTVVTLAGKKHTGKELQIRHVDTLTTYHKCNTGIASYSYSVCSRGAHAANVTVVGVTPQLDPAPLFP